MQPLNLSTKTEPFEEETELCHPGIVYQVPGYPGSAAACPENGPQAPGYPGSRVCPETVLQASLQASGYPDYAVNPETVHQAPGNTGYPGSAECRETVPQAPGHLGSAMVCPENVPKVPLPPMPRLNPMPERNRSGTPQALNLKVEQNPPPLKPMPAGNRSRSPGIRSRSSGNRSRSPRAVHLAGKTDKVPKPGTNKNGSKGIWNPYENPESGQNPESEETKMERDRSIKPYRVREDSISRLGKMVNHPRTKRNRSTGFWYQYDDSDSGNLGNVESRVAANTMRISSQINQNGTSFHMDSILVQSNGANRCASPDQDQQDDPEEVAEEGQIRPRPSDDLVHLIFFHNEDKLDCQRTCEVGNPPNGAPLYNEGYIPIHERVEYDDVDE